MACANNRDIIDPMEIGTDNEIKEFAAKGNFLIQNDF
jgi:hypothetical protein